MLEFVEARCGMTNLKMTPKMIIIHYTEIPTYQRTIAYFRPDEAEKGRPMLCKYGRVNVGTQFVVDRRGGVHQLYPSDSVTRQVTGFNHLAIGVENVAMGPRRLTKVQLYADRDLVRMLCKKYPTIEYLIGHHEYNRADLPHYRLYYDLVTGYELENFDDPGPAFMKKLRALLNRDGIRLKD